MVPRARAAFEDHLTYKLVSLWESAGLNGARLIEALDDAEIEAILRGYPNTPTEPLVLFAMLTMSNNVPDKDDEKLTAWVGACASWFCLEWLKRRGAVADYSVKEEGASWTSDSIRLSSVIFDDLATRHPALHHFATYVLQRAVASLRIDGPALN